MIREHFTMSICLGSPKLFSVIGPKISNMTAFACQSNCVVSQLNLAPDLN